MQDERTDADRGVTTAVPDESEAGHPRSAVDRLTWWRRLSIAPLLGVYVAFVVFALSPSPDLGLSCSVPPLHLVLGICAGAAAAAWCSAPDRGGEHR